MVKQYKHSCYHGVHTYVCILADPTVAVLPPIAVQPTIQLLYLSVEPNNTIG